LTTHGAAQVDNWAIGGSRFPTQSQNPYLNFNSFAYPGAFTVGNLGRNVFEAPGLAWTQFSIAKWWTLKERYRFQIRLDGNNFPFKQPQYGDPSGTFNANSPGAFARIGSATRGAFSDIGTANSNLSSAASSFEKTVHGNCQYFISLIPNEFSLQRSQTPSSCLLTSFRV